MRHLQRQRLPLLSLATALTLAGCGGSQSSLGPSDSPRTPRWGGPHVLGDTGSRLLHRCGARDFCPPYVYSALGVGPSGHAIAAWTRADDDGRYSLWAARLVPASGWIPPVAISAERILSIEGPRVAVDAQGYAVVLWSESSRENENPGRQIMSARFGPSGWAAPETISSAAERFSGSPDVGLTAAGDGVAVWTSGTGCGIASALFRSGRWEAPQFLAGRCTGGSFAHVPRVIVFADGSALAEWRESGRVLWRHITAAGTPLAVEDVAVSEEEPRVDGDARGNLVQARWAGSGRALEARRFLVAAGWQPAAAIVSFEGPLRTIPGTDQRVSWSGPLATSAGGAALATWMQHPVAGVSGEHGFWSRSYLPATGWSEPVRIYGAVPDSYESALGVAANDDGTALALWTSRERLSQEVGIWSSRLVNGRWTDKQALTTSTDVRQVTGLRSGANGDAVAMWHEESLAPSGMGIGPVTIWTNRFAPQ
jgi:hypothetical protein